MEIHFSKINKYDDINEIYDFFNNELSETYSFFTFSLFCIYHSDHCFLAKIENQIIGAILGKTENTIHGYIGLLAVKRIYRRKNIGSKLLKLCIDSFDTNIISLETETDNLGSINLYEKFGFIKCDYFTKYYLNGKDAFKMCLYKINKLAYCYLF